MLILVAKTVSAQMMFERYGRLDEEELQYEGESPGGREETGRITYLQWQRFEEGKRAYQMRDYPRAHAFWSQLARERVPEAQYNLGAMYLQGQGVEKDIVEAMRWFLIAEKNGSAEAAKFVRELRPFLTGKQMSEAHSRARRLS